MSEHILLTTSNESTPRLSEIRPGWLVHQISSTAQLDSYLRHALNRELFTKFVSDAMSPNSFPPCRLLGCHSAESDAYFGTIALYLYIQTVFTTNRNHNHYLSFSLCRVSRQHQQCGMKTTNCCWWRFCRRTGFAVHRVEETGEVSLHTKTYISQ